MDRYLYFYKDNHHLWEKACWKSVKYHYRSIAIMLFFWHSMEICWDSNEQKKSMRTQGFHISSFQLLVTGSKNSILFSNIFLCQNSIFSAKLSSKFAPYTMLYLCNKFGGILWPSIDPWRLIHSCLVTPNIIQHVFQNHKTQS